MGGCVGESWHLAGHQRAEGCWPTSANAELSNVARAFCVCEAYVHYIAMTQPPAASATATSNAHLWRYAQRMPTCCFCFPLRMGVFLNAILTFSAAFMAILFAKKSDSDDPMRVLTGGYSIYSRSVRRGLEWLALIFGICGILGTLKCEARFVRLYNRFQLTRIILWLGMWLCDIPLLYDCELWITDINKALRLQGWNPVMYNVAMSGNCRKDRRLFFVFSTLWWFFLIYLWSNGNRYWSELEQEPRYLIRIPKETPSGAFYAQGLRERSEAPERPMFQDIPPATRARGWGWWPPTPEQAPVLNKEAEIKKAEEELRHAGKELRPQRNEHQYHQV